MGILRVCPIMDHSNPQEGYSPDVRVMLQDVLQAGNHSVLQCM